MSEMSVKESVFAQPERLARAHTERGAVQWDDRFDAWVVRSHALVDRVLREHAVFSSRELEVGPPADHADNPVLHSLLALDPPEHQRLRHIVSQAFTPRAIDRAEQRIAATAAELAAGFGPAPEVVAGFAVPLTTSMLAHLVGLPDDHRDDFVRWTYVISAYLGSAATDPLRRKEFHGVLAEIEQYLRAAAADGAVAEDTVLAALLAATGAGTLSERELLDFLILLVVAGHETTTRLIYHAVLCLEKFPAVHDAVAAGTVPVANLVEEVARYLPPTVGTDRFTTADTELDGQPVAAGSRVVAFIAAANRDPAVFPDPERFDPTRGSRAHLGFGRGVHACLGAHLARREAVIALGHLLAAVPGRWHVPDDGLEADVSPFGTDINRLVLRRA